MRSILNKSNIRQLRLVEYLYENGSRTINELEKKMIKDGKTIKKDIDMVNNILSPIVIEKTSFGQYILIIPEGYNIDYVYSCFLRSSIEFQLIEEIMIYENLSYELLAERLFISVSTLQRMIKRLNKLLPKFNMEIKTSPFRLVGDEISILNYFYFYLKEKYQVTERFLTKIEDSLLDDFLISVLPYFSLKWTYTLSEMLKWIIYSNICRMRNGHVNYLVEELDLSDAISKEVNKDHELKNRFERVFKMTFSDLFLKQILYILFQPTYVNSVADLKRLEKKNVEVKNKVKAITRILISIEKRIGLSSLQREQLIFELYSSTTLYFGVDYILNDTNGRSEKLLEYKSPAFSKFLNSSFSKENKYLNTDEYNKFAFFLCNNWEELYLYLDQSKIKMKVGVVVSTSRSNAELIASELEKIFPDKMLITIINNVKLKEIPNFDIDLLVTNIAHLNIKKDVVCISQLMTNEEIAEISNFYNNWLRINESTYLKETVNSEEN